MEPDYLTYEVKPQNDEIYILIGDAEFSCDKKRYARQILKIFDNYLFSHDTEEYVAQWHCDYPKNAVEELRYQLQKAI